MGTGRFCKAIPASVDDGKPRYEATYEGKVRTLVFVEKDRKNNEVTWRDDVTHEIIVLKADQAKRIDGSNTVTTHSCYA